MEDSTNNDITLLERRPERVSSRTLLWVALGLLLLLGVALTSLFTQNGRLRASLFSIFQAPVSSTQPPLFQDVEVSVCSLKFRRCARTCPAFSTEDRQLECELQCSDEQNQCLREQAQPTSRPLLRRWNPLDAF